MATDSGGQIEVLTTVLTTTVPDTLPLRPILMGVRCQVSHGMPQPARFLQARGRASFATGAPHWRRLALSGELPGLCPGCRSGEP